MNDAAEGHAAGAEAASGRRLSFAFAKRHGVLVSRVVDGIAECIYRDTASPQALAEVRRFLRRSLRLERVPEAQFDALLRQAYEADLSAYRAIPKFVIGAGNLPPLPASDGIGIGLGGAMEEGQPVINSGDCIGAVVAGVCHGTPAPGAPTATCYGQMVGGVCTGPMF